VLGWVLLFLLLAIVAALLGFGGIAGAAAGIAQILFVVFLVLLVVAAAALTSLGTFFAWKTDSSQGFHAIMNLVLMPLWLLSGGFFPAPALTANARTSEWLLHGAMRVNPLSYAVGGVRRLLVPAAEYPGAWVPGLTSSWLVTIGFAAVAFSLAVWISRERTAGDLQ
jgi:uncharacterized membrane protein YtjA (UPF0391 family)